MTGVDNSGDDNKTRASFKDEPTRIVPQVPNTSEDRVLVPTGADAPTDTDNGADSLLNFDRDGAGTVELHADHSASTTDDDADFELGDGWDNSNAASAKTLDTNGLEQTAVLPENLDADGLERTAVYTPTKPGENYEAITAVYQGNDNSTALNIAAHSLSVDPNDLPATIVSPGLALRTNLEELDFAYREPKNEVKPFFSLEEYNRIKNDPYNRLKDLSIEDDFSAFNPYFADETNLYANTYGEQLKKVFEKSGDEPDIYERSGFVKLTKSVSALIDGQAPGAVPSMFHALLDKQKSKSSEAATEYSKKLVQNRLISRLVVSARDFLNSDEVSQEQKDIFLLHSIMENPSDALTRRYDAMFNKAFDHLQNDLNYLDEDFFNGKYKEGLRKALEIELGASKQSKRDFVSAMEKSPAREDQAKKLIVAQKFNQNDPLPGILSEIAFETQRPSFLSKAMHPIKTYKAYKNPFDVENAYQKEVIEELADNLRRQNTKLDNFSFDTKNTVAEVYWSEIGTRAYNNAIQIMKASKKAIFDDASLFEAYANKDSNAVNERLTAHLGKEHMQDPLRRFFLLKMLAGDSDFTKRVEFAQRDKALAFKKQPLIRFGVPTALTGTAAGLLAWGAVEFQERKDPYFKPVAAATVPFNDQSTFDSSIIEKREGKLTAINNWAKRIFTNVQELLSADRQGLLEKNNAAGILAKFIEANPGLRKFKERDSSIISLEIPETTERYSFNAEKNASFKIDFEALKDQLEEVLFQAPELKGKFNDPESKQAALNEAINGIKALVEASLKLDENPPLFLVPITVTDPDNPNQTIQTTILNTMYIKTFGLKIDSMDGQQNALNRRRIFDDLTLATRSMAMHEYLRDSSRNFIENGTDPQEAQFSREIFFRIKDSERRLYQPNGQIADNFRIDKGEKPILK